MSRKSEVFGQCWDSFSVFLMKFSAEIIIKFQLPVRGDVLTYHKMACYAVGGGSGFFDGFLDILPLFLLWVALMASVTWAALQLYVGARFLGPLGICMAWAIYQVINLL